MPPKNMKSGPPSQARYVDHDADEWAAKTSRRPPAAVLCDGDTGSEKAARVVPAGAQIVRLGKTGKVIAGYRKPARRGVERREFAFRLFRQTELLRLAEWRISVGIALGDDAGWARAIASVAEPNVAASWINRLCPGLSPFEISSAIDETTRTGVRFSAQQLGDLISLSVEEREGLDIRSIRPAGMSGREFARYARQRAREHGRKRDEARRRAAGMKPRRRGESAAEEAAREGISIATVYRRRRASSGSAACEMKTRHEYSKVEYCAHSPVTPLITAPAWLIRLFATRTPIPVNDPNAPPETARIGALVASHAAALRAAREAA